MYYDMVLRTQSGRGNDPSYLDSLSVIAEDIDADDSLVEVRIRTLHNVIIEVLLEAEYVHPLEDEIEQCFQVLWTRTCDEDVRVPMSESCSDSQTQGGRLSATTSRSECYSRRECLLCNGIHES